MSCGEAAREAESACLPRVGRMVDKDQLAYFGGAGLQARHDA